MCYLSYHWVAHFCLRIKYEVVFMKRPMLLLISNENDFERMITVEEVLMDNKYVFINGFKNNARIQGKMVEEEQYENRNKTYNN